MSAEELDALEADDGDAVDCWDCGGRGYFLTATDDMSGDCDEFCTCGGCYESKCETCGGKGFLRVSPDAPASPR